MKNKRSFIKAASLAAAATAAFVPVFLYFFLIGKDIEGAIAYSRPGILLSFAVSFAAAFAIFTVLVNASGHGDLQDPDEECEPEDICHGIDEETCEVSDECEAEYPELFFKKEEPCVTAEECGAPSYYEVLSKAIAAQKTDSVIEDTEGEKISEVDSILDMPKPNRTETFDIYDSLPDTLPEGYVVLGDDEDEPCEEDGEADEKKTAFPASAGMGVFARAGICLAAFALSCAFSTVLSFNGTLYYEDGFAVRSLGGDKNYRWEDCTAVEIAPSFFGDSLSVTVTTGDGRKTELLPSGEVLTEEFFEKYKSIYSYARIAAEKMTAAGALKTVRERNTIESRFAESEYGEQIRNLID